MSECPRNFLLEDILAGLKAGRRLRVDRHDAPELDDLADLLARKLIDCRLITIDEQTTALEFFWIGEGGDADVPAASAGQDSSVVAPPPSASDPPGAAPTEAMIEAGARAFCAAAGGDPDEPLYPVVYPPVTNRPPGGTPLWTAYVRLARAVIVAALNANPQGDGKGG